MLMNLQTLKGPNVPEENEVEGRWSTLWLLGDYVINVNNLERKVASLSLITMLFLGFQSLSMWGLNCRENPLQWSWKVFTWQRQYVRADCVWPVKLFKHSDMAAAGGVDV